jgi:histidine triad (HIT) family protein
LSECLFCAIVAGSEPASLVHSDELCIAFMDLYPLREGHVLVVPRDHAVFLHDLVDDIRLHLFAVGARIVRAQRAAGIPWEGSQLLVNDGPAAGQLVPHVHLHLIPRTRGDTPRVVAGFVARALGRFGAPRPRARLDALAERIREAL